MTDEEDGGQANASASQHSAPRTLILVADDGKFCLGPREKVHPILDVQRYVARWPLIPTAELHASSVQHPDDIDMRWLLHTSRVKCTAEPTPDSRPRCAGVGDKAATVWCCKLCIHNLCTQKPRMPPLALSNDLWLGRHHPLFREATLATRMLASSARLLMRQLFLGRGAPEDVHKGMTGNTVLIAQPAPSYAQVLPT